MFDSISRKNDQQQTMPRPYHSYSAAVLVGKEGSAHSRCASLFCTVARDCLS
jgi:hypothetical protein